MVMITFLGEEIIPRSDIVLPGEHNLENIMAAIAANQANGSAK